MKRLISTLLGISFLALNACSQNTNYVFPEVEQAQSSAKKEITTKARLDTPPFIAQGNEFSVVAIMDDGKIIKYQTFKAGKPPATIVYQSKWNILESHQTTASEANTILKLLSQNGSVKEFKSMQEKYEEAGLLRK